MLQHAENKTQKLHNVQCDQGLNPNIHAHLTPRLESNVQERQFSDQDLPDSPLEECSEPERESDRCLFFFVWFSSSSSDSEP